VTHTNSEFSPKLNWCCRASHEH